MVLPGRWALICLTLLMVSSASAIVYDNPRFGGCAISTDRGALQDADCDRQPDPSDNCPLNPNQDQLDRDDNGIGDACDLIIEEIRIEPQTPMQGRSVVMSISIMNNRAYPMRNVVVKGEAPSLSIGTFEDVPVIQPGERRRAELVMRVPECARVRPADFVAIAEYPFAPGQSETFSQSVNVNIAASGLCGPQSDQTSVNILEWQDVRPIEGAIYPFTIRNTQAESKAYVLSVDHIDDWGYAQIFPGTVVVVPAGETREGAVQVWANEGVSGRHSFALTIQAKDDVKQVMLLANVPQAQERESSTPPTKILLGILAFVIILVILGFVYTFAAKR
jgi:hypothetical protein